MSLIASSNRIPVILLTGFLGSGKTTVLNHLVQQPAFADSLVIINEFGGVSLDHHLVVPATEQVVMALESGCLCCSIRHDLVRTLNDVHWRFAREGKRQFKRVLIETTGLADPASIIHTMTTHPRVISKYQLENVVTVVDTLTGDLILNRYPEARRQVAVANVLLMTKSDLATPIQKRALIHRLAGKHSATHSLFVEQGRVNPDVVLTGGFSSAAIVDQGIRFFSPPVKASNSVPGNIFQPAFFSDPSDVYPGASFHHDDGIYTVHLFLDTPIRKEVLEQWLSEMVKAYGPQMLRMKGIINVEGEVVPSVIQAVQHTVFPLKSLKAWPDEDHRSRLVFITHDINSVEMQTRLNALEAALLDT